jgi:hypothetical protein
VSLATEFGKLAGKLGVCVQVLPPGGHFAVKQIDEMWNLHDGRLKFEVTTLGDAWE